jgi:hypothetical protein
MWRSFRRRVRPGDEDRAVLVALAREPAGPEQPLVLERPGEKQLRLSVSLLDREHAAGDHPPRAVHRDRDRQAQRLPAPEDEPAT